MKKTMLFSFLLFLIIIALFSTEIFAQPASKKKRSLELTKKAISLYKYKQYDRAKDALLKAVKLDGKNVKAHEMLSLLYYQERNFTAARHHAKTALKLSQKSAGAYYVLGMISYQQGEEEKARFHLNQAVKFLKNPERRANAKNILEKLKTRLKDESRPSIRNKIKKLREERAVETQKSDYKPYIAVFNFKESNTRAADLELGTTLTEMLVTALVQSGKFTVMERIQLEKILQEQSLTQSGVIDAETAIKVGKLAGVEAVTLGSVSHLKTSIEADVRLINIKTAQAITAANGSIKNVDQLRNLANELAKKLAVNVNLIQPKTSNKDTSDTEN